MPTLLNPVRNTALTGDERRPARGAALLAVGVREPHPLVGDAIDVRRPVAHQAVAVGAQVRDPDVIAPDDDDVGLVSVWHVGPPGLRGTSPRNVAGIVGEPSSPEPDDPGRGDR